VATYQHSPGYDYLIQLPDIHVLGLDSPGEALAAVELGQADVAVLEATLGLRERDARELKDVRPPAPLEGTYISLHLGVRADQPKLARLLDQLILAIPPTEHAAILSHWLGLPETGIDPRRVLQWVAAVLGTILLLALLFLLWNRQLQRELARRQAKIHERQQLMEAIFHSIPDLFFRLSPDGTILDYHANDTSELYVAPEHFLGKKMQEILPEHMSDKLENILQQLKQSRHPIAFEYRLPVPKGERYFEAKFNRMADSDQIVILVRDITDRKRAEEELRWARDELERRVVERTEELAAANRELESFTYAVSHDLRAPLRAIRGFGEALIEDYGAQIPKGAQDYLEEISFGARRMGELIEGLLALSRTTHSELERTPVRLDEIAREVCMQLVRNEPDRQITLEISEPLTVTADLRLSRTLMQNLMENAWKYTRDRKQARIAFYSRKQNGEQVFCLEDDGAGFDMAFAAKLFEPFQSRHGPDEFPGIGIGLATVWRIVKRHGGWIKGEGEVGKSARFCFTLSPREESR